MALLTISWTLSPMVVDADFRVIYWPIGDPGSAITKTTTANPSLFTESDTAYGFSTTVLDDTGYDFTVEQICSLLNISLPATGEVIPIYTKCADCTLSMSTSSPAHGKLSASVVTSEACLVGDYVIDWYRDATGGTPEFTSGNDLSTDPDVDVAHPFTAFSATAGNYHPVIRFIELDAIVYSSTLTEGLTLSEDLSNCFSDVVVPPGDCLTCGLSCVITTPYPSFLSAGPLASTTCIVGEYIIDWYGSNGLVAFTSGSATAPSVLLRHPFVNEIVAGDTYQPRIRYVYLDGVKYSSVAMAGAVLSPNLLGCLNAITVDTLKCSNGSTYVSPAGASYTHKLSYNYTSDVPTQAARTFRFDLDDVNRQFAWFFYGQSVSDAIKIYLVKPLTNTTILLENWIVGADAAQNITLTPQTTNSTYAYKITDLRSYSFAVGDYLRIEITPSLSSLNTSWDFYCRCLTGVINDLPTSEMRKIVDNSVSMAYNSSTCAWVLSYTHPTWAAYGTSLLERYTLKYFYNSAGGTYYSPSAASLSHSLFFRTSANYNNTGVNTSCQPLLGSMTATKVGSTLTVSFTSLTDYLNFKNEYELRRNMAVMLTYSSDPTLLDYYKFLEIRLRNGTVCPGDNFADYILDIHYGTTPNWDENGKTMSVTLPVLTNQFVPINSCDVRGGFTLNYINAYNNRRLGADYTFTTNIRVATQVIGLFFTTISDNELSKNNLLQRVGYLSVDTFNLVTENQFSTFNPGLHEYRFTYFNDYVVITDFSDPANNFELWRRCTVLDGEDIPLLANYKLVYKKSKATGSVVITNNIAAYNAGTL